MAVLFLLLKVNLVVFISSCNGDCLDLIRPGQMRGHVANILYIGIGNTFHFVCIGRFAQLINCSLKDIFQILSS